MSDETGAAPPRKKRISSAFASPPGTLPPPGDPADLPPPPPRPAPRAPKQAAPASVTTLSSAMEKLLKKAKKQADGRPMFAGGGAAGDSMQLLPFGIPFPSLAMAWGMGCSVWPAGRLTQLVGLYGGGKSIIAHDIARWILELCEARQDVVPLIPGTVSYQENEGKKATDLFWSIFEWREQYRDVYSLEETTLMDEWVEHARDRFKEWPDLFEYGADHNGKVKNPDNPGWIVPLLFVVDSLCSTQTRAALDKFFKEGSVQSAHATRSNALTNFAGLLPALISKRPIWFIATNHLKEYVDSNGNPTRNVPGGRAFHHMESTELEIKRVADLRDEQGFTTSIRFWKNCFGDSRRRIEVDVRWTYTYDETQLVTDLETGEEVPKKVQWTMVDWPTADIKLLERLKEKEPEVYREVAKHLDLNVTQGRIWSEALGIPQKERVTRHEAGCILNENAAVLDKIMPLMGITTGRMFLPGMDYQKEAYRTDVRPDSMAVRPYRRPTCGVLTGLVREGEGVAS